MRKIFILMTLLVVAVFGCQLGPFPKPPPQPEPPSPWDNPSDARTKPARRFAVRQGVREAARAWLSRGAADCGGRYVHAGVRQQRNRSRWDFARAVLRCGG